MEKLKIESIFFFIWITNYVSHYKYNFFGYMLLLTVGMLDVQIESATALILCAISCIILIIPIKPTSIKMLAVVILTSIAGNVLQLTFEKFH